MSWLRISRTTVGGRFQRVGYFTPKPGRPSEWRPLSIPTVRDRVVQAEVKTVIEPIFEADKPG
jgi:hypothetical protein